jgi:hypothetical protein
MRTIRIPLLTLFLCLGLATGAWAQSGTIAPNAVFTGFTNSGAVCSSCRLYTYASGTSTPATVYSNSTLTTPHANPIILDSAGRATIYVGAASFKFVLKTAADVTLWTVDPVTSTAVAQTQLGEFFYFGGDSTSPVTLTAYPSGATVDKTHAGTSVYSVDSADIPAGTYILEGMLLGTGGGTVTAALVNLSDGSPDTPMVTISSASTVGSRTASSAITFAASGTSKFYAIKTLVSTGGGFAWGLRLRRTG